MDFSGLLKSLVARGLVSPQRAESLAAELAPQPQQGAVFQDQSSYPAGSKVPNGLDMMVVGPTDQPNDPNTYGTDPAAPGVEQVAYKPGPNTQYVVKNRHTGKTTYHDTRNGATRASDYQDNQYGGYITSISPYNQPGMPGLVDPRD